MGNSVLNIYRSGLSTNCDSCVLCIPGRGQHGRIIADYYSSKVTKNTAIVAPTSKDFEWYPLPNGSKDQRRSVQGIQKAAEWLERLLDNDLQDIPRNRIVLSGFSAGGVMALELASRTENPFAGVICHSGAILDIEGVKECSEEKKNMPIWLYHQKDDEVFSWDERYIPMKNTLITKRYNTNSYESTFGNHTILEQHGNHVKQVLDYCFFSEISHKPSNVNISTT